MFYKYDFSLNLIEKKNQKSSARYMRCPCVTFFASYANDEVIIVIQTYFLPRANEDNRLNRGEVAERRLKIKKKLSYFIKNIPLPFKV